MAANDNEGIRMFDEFFDALRAALKSADASERATLKKALEARIGDFPIESALVSLLLLDQQCVQSVCDKIGSGIGNRNRRSQQAPSAAHDVVLLAGARS